MTKNLNETLRAPFSPELQELRSHLVTLVPLLEKQPNWYGSVYFEKKSGKSYVVDFKKSNVTDQLSMGVVLRIYDGYTLYEQATDNLSFDALTKCAHQLVKRVESASNNSDPKYYQPPTWGDRLNRNFEDEILCQIPSTVDKNTEVHFGVRYKIDPRIVTSEERFKKLKLTLDKIKELAPKNNLSNEELTYAIVREGFHQEESIFIDRESNLSQTLYRCAISCVAMTGGDRNYLRNGGLGGLEATEVKDEEINTLLKDLSGIKNATRMNPGKYRVLFSPGLTGVLAHEAFGHSQEGDTCAKGRSKAWELYRSKEKVGNEHATILNNPAIYHNGAHDYTAWGSYFFDEEGWLAQEQILLNKGVLQRPMTHLTSSIRLGVPRTANGKRESWSHGVYTRQTNTYFSAGTQTYDELIEQIDDGFLVTQCAGGMEDPKGMGIQVGMLFLKEVKNGKVTGKYFRGPAGGDIQMTGYTPDVLTSIIGKSKIEFNSKNPDSAKHPENDCGGCGKYHKEVVVAGCGGPYLLLDQIILG